jgi:thymidylate kinase
VYADQTSVTVACGYSIAELDVASIIEAAAAKSVLVVGSLPPSGRDWDLLVHDTDRAAIEAQLAATGFMRAGRRWVRLRGDTREVVELVGRAEWRLPENEVDRLFADAVPLDGHARLCIPSPPDRLLILARKLPRTPGFLEPKHRKRIHAALSEDPAAFACARKRAPTWQVGRDLRRLEGRYVGRPRSRRPPAYLRRPCRGAIIAFSGLDGVGKSTQAQALGAALAAIGYEAEVIWAPVGQNATLRRFASSVKHAASHLPIGPLSRVRGEAVESHLLSRTEPEAPAFGPSRKFASGVWSTVTTLANALVLRRAAHGTRIRGRVAIYDRYVLDTVVDLRFRYHPGAVLRFQEALLRALAPSPQRAYLLDVAPEVAHRREPDWSLTQTRLRAELYRRERAARGVRPLDANRTVDDLHAEILQDVLDSLAG